MSVPVDLQAVRAAIEQLDRELLTLLRRRMELVEEVASAKLGAAHPLRDPPREEQVLRRVRQLAVELKLDPHPVERLFRVVMEMSISRQQAWIRSLESAPLRIAFPGLEGSHSHLAAQSRYARRPGGALLTGYETARAVVDAVARGHADVGLLPIEDTTAGSMHDTYDLLAEGAVRVTAELVGEVAYRLLVFPGVRVEELRTVLSHPQAFVRCEAFLRTVPWIRPQAEPDAAGSARKVSLSGDRTQAAIASESAARLFGLEALPQPIQDERDHFTRYVEIALEAPPCPPGVPCKSSFLVVLDHRPGTLGQVLTLLARHGVNLCRIESRPIPGEPWKYRFYLDLEGHAESAPVSDALDEVRPLTSELRLLGSYPRAAPLTETPAVEAPELDARVGGAVQESGRGRG